MNFNFKKLPPFKWFVLQNFPFIEADFDAITYYQLLCKIVEYLNKVIDENNLIGEQTENLTNAFNELQDYVNHYFDNLDVQNEINNKLDEMAEGGQLTDIIAQYLQLAGVLAFNNVNDMKNSTNLVNGSIVKTLGFYNYNDGGGAFYKIRNITNSDVVDNKKIINLINSNNLIAEIVTKKANPLQFGAKGDGISDDTSVIQYTFNFACEEQIPVFLPSPTNFYGVTSTLIVPNNSIGIICEEWNYTGIIRPLSSDFTIMEINPAMGFYCKNLSIGSQEMSSNNGLLIKGHCGMNLFEHIRIYNLNGFGMKINSLWDSNLNEISIELCGNSSEYAFSMNDDGDCCNMSIIERLQVEQSNQKSIYISPNTLNCVFNDIHSERTRSLSNGSYVFGGNCCHYDTMRLSSENDTESIVDNSCHFTGVSNYYNNCLIEDYIEVQAEGINLNSIEITNSRIYSINEKVDQNGKIIIKTSDVSYIKSRNHIIAYDTKIYHLILQWTNVDFDGLFFNCNIIEVTKDNRDCRIKCINCKIGTMISDEVHFAHFIDCTISAFSLNNYRLAYSSFKFENCTINSTINIDGSQIYCLNTKINGDLNYSFGDQIKIFKDCVITGTIHQIFSTVPTFIPSIGEKTDNLIPSSSSPIGWVYTSNGWKGYGTIS